MTWQRAISLVWVLLVASSSQAGVMLTFDGLPTSFTPGDSFTFSVKLTGAQGLASYDIPLVLSAASGTPEVDFGFDPVPTAAPANYVFPSDLFFFAIAFPQGAEDHLAISDFNFDSGFNLVGVDTVAGVNDVLAVVSVTTTTGVTGPLTISIDESFLQLDNVDLDPIPDFADVLANLPATTITQSQQATVPEPASLLVWSLGAAGLTVISRRRCKRDSSSAGDASASS